MTKQDQMNISEQIMNICLHDQAWKLLTESGTRDYAMVGKNLTSERVSS